MLAPSVRKYRHGGFHLMAENPVSQYVPRGERYEIRCRRCLFCAAWLYPDAAAYGVSIGEARLCHAGSVRDVDLVVYECFHVIDKPGDREGRPQRIQAGLPGEFYAIYDHRSS